MTGQRVEIIGGGFSGLSLAYFLTNLGVPVIVREKSHRLGGLISTEKLPWGLSEAAANGFLNSPLVEDVMADLGVEMAKVQPEARKRYIFREWPRRWPLGFFETLGFLLGVLKFMVLPFLRRPRANETMQSYVTRNFGKNVFRFLVGPALQGVYSTADLSAEAIYDSMFGIYRVQPSRKFRRGSVAPKDGMEAVLRAFERRLREKGQGIVCGEESVAHLHRPSVIAVPAPEAALILSSEAPEVAKQLATLSYLPVTTVTVAFSKEAPGLRGFGCLFNREENFESLGVLVNSCMFSDRSADGYQIETWIFSGSEVTDVENKIVSDRARLLGVGSGEAAKPLGLKITRWPHGIPHYNLQLNEVRKSIEMPQGLYLTGNYLGRIGLTKILQYNFELAQKIKAEI